MQTLVLARTSIILGDRPLQSSRNESSGDYLNQMGGFQVMATQIEWELTLKGWGIEIL